MKLQKVSFEKFGKEICEKRLICFGASKMPKEMCMLFGEYRLEQQIAYFVDNNPEKWGETLHMSDREVQVISLASYIELRNSEDILIITSRYYPEIIEQLRDISELENMKCYVYPLLYFEKGKEGVCTLDRQLIPKKIHYCWFGGGAFSEKEKSCMDSWKKMCPDYEIVRWDETNTDIFQNLYVKQAYEKKKWAFVSDYVRLDIVYRYGGIYLDTDVELVKNLDDMLYQQGFTGFEMSGMVNTGSALGAMPNLEIIKILRDEYDRYTFLNVDGTLNEDACIVYQTRTLKKYGLVIENRLQNIAGLNIYPVETFCPLDLRTGRLNRTEGTRAIHHFEGSWWSQDNRKYHEMRQNYILENN